MKITAHFNSPDNADFAAGSLKRILSPLSTIETENQSFENSNININIFPVFNLTSITPSYSIPVKANAINERSSCDSCILKVVCRKEEAAEVMRVIIGYGGRNITKI